MIYLTDKNFDSLKDLKISDLRTYFTEIKNTRKLLATSLYKKIAIIKSFFNYLQEEVITIENPSLKIKFPKKEKVIPKVFSEDDFKLLISCIKFSPSGCRKNLIRDTLIFSMLYYCGLRRGELLALNWDDIKLGQKTLTVRKSKNKSFRIMPLHSVVLNLLNQYLEQRLPLKNSALFVGFYNVCVYWT